MAARQQVQHGRWVTKTLQGRRWLVERRQDAVELNNPAQLLELLSYQPTHKRGELSNSLQIAILKKSDEYARCIEILLKHGANPNGTAGRGTPFILLASVAGCIKCLQLLLDSGADIGLTRSDGTSALHRAAQENQIPCVEALLNSGADTNTRDSLGRTPLLLAAQAGHCQTAQVLLKFGCSAQVCDRQGRSALHWAAEQDNTDLASLLLTAGCDPNMSDTIGRTPLLTAAEKGHHALLGLLLNNEADQDVLDSDRNTALLLASRNGHLECALKLILSGSNVNYCNGDTALVLLLSYPRITYELLMAGADVDIQSASGHSPLLLATEHENDEVVRLLLKAGCDIEDIEEYPDCRHPLQIAIHRGNLTIVRYIFLSCLMAGANLNWLQGYVFSEELDLRCIFYEASRQCKLWLQAQMQQDSDSMAIVQCLQHLCRWTIRSELGSAGLLRAVNHLPLPTALKDYISFVELDVIQY